MGERNQWSGLATFAVGAGAAIGVAAALYYAYEHNEHQNQNMLQHGHQRSGRRGNDPSWNFWEGPSSTNNDENRTLTSRDEGLIRLREERRRQLEIQEEVEREKERQKKLLAAELKRLEAMQKLEEEKESRLKNEEEERRETEKMESMLDSFENEFDIACGTTAEEGPVDSDFEYWSMNKKKEQLKQEHRRQQRAKCQESQEEPKDYEKANIWNNANEDTNATNEFCQKQSANSTYVTVCVTGKAQVLEVTDNSPGIIKTDPQPVRKPKTEEQKASQRRKKKLRRQKKRLASKTPPNFESFDSCESN